MNRIVPRKRFLLLLCLALLAALSLQAASTISQRPNGLNREHWSFLKPEAPPLPVVRNKAWPRNGIDYFILARLEKEKLGPSSEADGATLIRRVTLDLTGLPSTIAEVDAFLSDDSPVAYEKVVDRLLASPRYGERMAIRWLDAARYADTSGYQSDGELYMWRWRDWVIDAFNQNMPFDRFTVEQIAGDMLPGATLDQKSQRASTETIEATGKGESSRRSTRSSMSWIVWTPRAQSGWG